jgi:hypothetical protein
MKAERRHELQHNELADWLGGVIDQAKPHAGVIVGVIAAAVLALVAVAFFSQNRGTRGGPAWDAYFRGSEIETFEQRVKELNRVAEDHPRSPAGVWAQLTVGDSRLLEGTNKSYKDRAAGEEEISKAIDNYNDVEKAASGLPKAQSEELRRRAMWGLAQAHEALSQPDEAIEMYEKLAKQWPESAFGKAAAARAKKLSSMQEWFTWYAGVDPKSIKPTQRDRQPPLDFTPPRQPQPYDDLPDDPDLSLPGPLDLDPTRSGGLLQDPPSGNTEPPAGESTETPAGETTDKPAGEEPATETPAESTPPAAGETSTPPTDDAGATEPAPPSDEAPSEEAKPAEEATPEGGN